MLFTSLSAYGSLHPVLRLGLAAKAVGHEVAISSAARMRASVERQDITFLEAGGEIPAAEVQARYPELFPLSTPAALARYRQLLFADVAIEKALPDMLEVCKHWQPDVVVRGHIELVGCLAAEELGIPHVVVEEHASGNLATLPSVMNEPLNKWRAIRGLAPDPEMEMLERYLTLLPFPASLRRPDSPFGPTARRIQPLTFSESGDEGLPEWMDSLPSGPVVHASLTTIGGRPDTPLKLKAIIEGLAGQPLSLVLVSGRDLDPESLGRLPANARVARYIPHSLLLPRCDAIITHAGAGSLIAAIDAGLPMVMIPGSGDQPDNAACAAAAGAGRVLVQGEVTPESVREAVLDVLSNPSYRRSVEAIQAEIRTLPSVEEAVGWIETVARTRAPFVT